MGTSPSCSDDFYNRLIQARLAAPPADNDAKVTYWLAVAALAIEHFKGDKPAFRHWIELIYTLDENRFAASACWDILKLQESAQGSQQ